MVAAAVSAAVGVSASSTVEFRRVSTTTSAVKACAVEAGMPAPE